jgi:subtilisin-like proprotein convertase family protein
MFSGALLPVLLALGVAPRARAILPKAPTPLDAQARHLATLHAYPGGVAFNGNPSLFANAPQWQQFLAEHGKQNIYLDPLTGRPLGVSGEGIPWIPGKGNSLTRNDIAGVMTPGNTEPGTAELERIARNFIASHTGLLRIPEGMSYSISPAASIAASPSMNTLWFNLYYQGVPVEGGALVFVVKHGNLILWGTQGLDDAGSLRPAVVSDRQALDAVAGHAGGFTPGVDTQLGKPRLMILPERDGERHGYRQLWEIRFERKGQGTYVGRIDAATGDVVEFFDDNQYAQVKGGIYPITNTAGTEVSRPFAFADYSPALFADIGGVFTYPGGTVTSNLVGKYVTVNDTCGAPALSASAPPGDLDFGAGTGTDCVTPGVGGPGNTHSARSCYYHTDLIKQKGRTFYPANAWLNANITANVNINNTCNAFWNGSTVNFYRSGGGCGNTGEIAGVFLHEWGHGMDSNDGNGAGGSGEAMGDTVAMLQLRDSCIGANFLATPCGGYGNACTTCTGVRDQDRFKHTTNLVITPANIATHCTSAGGDPCGREVHCEGELPANAVWDMAFRDLAARPDLPTANDAWALSDKLWWESGAVRNAAYTCANTTGAPWNNGCGVSSWYQTFLAADDDDGNLANGTPHAATIFASFDRHGISCGTAATTANTDHTTCPAIGAVGTLSGTAGNNSSNLSWTLNATNAASYNVLRNNLGCGFGFTLVGSKPAPTLTYTDAAASNGTAWYYQVQAVGANPDCVGAISNCVSVTPQPCAGSVLLSRSVYSCSDSIGITLTDSDLTGSGSHAVTVRSTTEAAPETKLLTETPPNSGVFTGSFATGAPPAVPGDNKVSVVNADTITVRYVDASFCGTPNVNVDATATADCVAPVITNVLASAITGQSALITWDTNEASNSRVNYGTTPPPASNVTQAANVVAHSVPLTGLAECTGYVFSVQSTDPASNTALANNGGAYFPFTTGKNTQPNYTSTDTPVAIPDNLPAGATSTIAVPDNKTVMDVNVTVNITHTFDGDLRLSLIPPSGPAIPLVTNRGGGGGNFTATVLDDSAATAISAGAAPFTGSFRPESPLTAANGINAAGNWQLFVVDTAGADVGTIDSWTLSLTYPAASCGTQVNTQSSTRSDVCAAGGAANGNTYLEPGENSVVQVTAVNNGALGATGVTGRLTTATPGVTIVNDTASFPNMGPSATGLSIAPHFSFVIAPTVPCGTTIPFQIQYTAAQGTWTDGFSYAMGQVTSASNSYNSTDVPKAINDLTTVTSTIVVPASGNLTDVNVGLSITHTYDADLDIFLIHPDGTRVELTTDNGAGGDNFTNTVFDDAAATAVTAGVAPFTGSFRPEGLLSTLNGKPAAGTWTLEVTDDASVDTGSLTAWSLTLVSGGGAPVCAACACGAAPAMSRVTHAKAGLNLVQSWLTVPGAFGFKVYRNTSSNPAGWGAANAAVNTLNWTDAGQLSSPTSQFYSVTDVSTCGNESPK